MLKRRTKRRRNPSMLEEIRKRRLTGYDNLVHYMHSVLKDGNPVDFVKSMILYKRGRYCNDCDKEYFECRCDDCEECGFVECLCPLNIKYKGKYPENYTDSEKETIKKEAYKFLLEILDDDLFNDGIKYNLIPNYSNFEKLKKELLKTAMNKSEINLSRADLYKEDLTKVNLSGADLSGAYLCRVNLRGANLSEALLYTANLSGAYLRGADLTGTDLAGVDLTGANLSGANLSRANLTGVTLSKTNLVGANLTGANLTGANLYKTDFTNTIIKNTIFNDTVEKEHAINLIIPNPSKNFEKKHKKLLKFL